MRSKFRQFFAIYQLFYGSLAAIYYAYFLVEAINTELQRVLMVSFLMLYAILVFMAGYYAWRNSTSWLPLTLAAQALQLYPLITQNLYLSLRCGVSVDFSLTTGGFNINLLDLNSAVSWREAPAFHAGFNVFALLLCLLLLAIRIRQKKVVTRLNLTVMDYFNDPELNGKYLGTITKDFTLSKPA